MRISESGIVNGSGKLRMPMDRLNEVFAKHPGARVIATFEVVERNTSEAQQGYYYGYVLPAIVDAFHKKGTRMSERRADRWLVEQYPGDIIREGNPVTIPRQMSLSQMTDFLEWLQQYAAENFEIYIEDPRTL